MTNGPLPKLYQSQHRVIIYINFNELESPTYHAKFEVYPHSSSVEEAFERTIPYADNGKTTSTPLGQQCVFGSDELKRYEITILVTKWPS